MSDVVEALGETVNADAPGVENTGPSPVENPHAAPVEQVRPEWLPEKFESGEKLADGAVEVQLL